MSEIVVLTLAEKIERARDGRTQKWIVKKMNEKLPDDDKITEVRFSRKKIGDNDSFTDLELKILSKILKTDLSQ